MSPGCGALGSASSATSCGRLRNVFLDYGVPLAGTLGAGGTPPGASVNSDGVLVVVQVVAKHRSMSHRCGPRTTGPPQQAQRRLPLLGSLRRHLPRRHRAGRKSPEAGGRASASLACEGRSTHLPRAQFGSLCLSAARGRSPASRFAICRSAFQSALVPVTGHEPGTPCPACPPPMSG